MGTAFIPPSDAYRHRKYLYFSYSPGLEETVETVPGQDELIKSAL